MFLLHSVLNFATFITRVKLEMPDDLNQRRHSVAEMHAAQAPKNNEAVSCYRLHLHSAMFHCPQCYGVQSLKWYQSKGEKDWDGTLWVANMNNDCSGCGTGMLLDPKTVGVVDGVDSIAAEDLEVSVGDLQDGEGCLDVRETFEGGFRDGEEISADEANTLFSWQKSDEADKIDAFNAGRAAAREAIANGESGPAPFVRSLGLHPMEAQLIDEQMTAQIAAAAKEGNPNIAAATEVKDFLINAYRPMGVHKDFYVNAYLSLSRRDRCAEIAARDIDALRHALRADVDMYDSVLDASIKRPENTLAREFVRIHEAMVKENIRNALQAPRHLSKRHSLDEWWRCCRYPACGGPPDRCSFCVRIYRIGLDSVCQDEGPWLKKFKAATDDIR